MVSLFGLEGRFSDPACISRVRGAQWPSRLNRRSPPQAARSGLDGHEHGAMLDQARAFYHVLPGSWFFPRSESAATWHRGGWHPYVPNAVSSIVSAATKDSGLPRLVPAWGRVSAVGGGARGSTLRLVPSRSSGIRSGRSKPGA
jgi:hypothetical protein